MSNREFPKKTEYYYIPSDVRDWIEENAKLENRSPSNFLTTLIRRLRDAGAGA